ncbi:MAG: CPBP family glutamic-type intramembrane protease, partial [Candidatus Marinimicrobia bacterium]|nr:CPBP family glutamic-type intramembrane protease [Candidatus Neomarinimicrobiota bacterium]
WKSGFLLLSALLFSAAHYLGAAGDSFNWLSFMARSLGGLVLGVVYLLRGLGPAVYTHAIYDIFTLL